MKTIIISGTPGTGKTTLSKELAKKLNFYYLDVNRIIKKYNISEGYDRKRKTKIVDINKLNKALINEISTIKKYTITKKINKNNIIRSTFKKNSLTKKSNKIQKNNIIIKNNKIQKIKNGIIIDSHLSHYLPGKYVDLCIIAKCDLKILKNRLKKKKYSEDKIRENLDAEIFDICLNEAKENKYKIIVVDTTKGINIGKIKNLVKW